MSRTRYPEFISRFLAATIKGLSYLPLSVLYVFAEIMSWFLYKVGRYRVDVVRENLQSSFPEKSLKELNAIERNFYHQFAQIVVEVVKLRTMSFEELRRRCHYSPESVQLLNDFYEQGKSVMIVMGHVCNWEWSGASFPLYNKHQVLTAYRPLKSKITNAETLKMRQRTGNILATMKNLPMEMFKLRKEIMATALIADQTPPPQNAFWIDFLHQDTPFFKGTEVLSQKFNLPLIWGGVRRVKRGYYQINLELITDNPRGYTEPGAITSLFASYLERDIQNQPESWLWSHRRWKHRRETN